MLVEVKVKVARSIEGKIKKRLETYLIDKEFFAEAEYAITEILTEESNSHLVEDFQIQSLRISPIMEIVVRFQGDTPYIATLKDVWLESDGTEKYLRYKVLLWANSLQEATDNIRELSREGYDMMVEGLKHTDYKYISQEESE